jgi:hypothetical protein
MQAPCHVWPSWCPVSYAPTSLTRRPGLELSALALPAKLVLDFQNLGRITPRPIGASPANRISALRAAAGLRARRNQPNKRETEGRSPLNQHPAADSRSTRQRMCVFRAPSRRRLLILLPLQAKPAWRGDLAVHRWRPECFGTPNLLRKLQRACRAILFRVRDHQVRLCQRVALDH